MCACLPQCTQARLTRVCAGTLTTAGKAVIAATPAQQLCRCRTRTCTHCWPLSNPFHGHCKLMYCYLPVHIYVFVETGSRCMSRRLQLRASLFDEAFCIFPSCRQIRARNELPADLFALLDHTARKRTTIIFKKTSETAAYIHTHRQSVCEQVRSSLNRPLHPCCIWQHGLVTTEPLFSKLS